MKKILEKTVSKELEYCIDDAYPSNRFVLYRIILEVYIYFHDQSMSLLYEERSVVQ